MVRAWCVRVRVCVRVHALHSDHSRFSIFRLMWFEWVRSHTLQLVRSVASSCTEPELRSLLGSSVLKCDSSQRCRDRENIICLGTAESFQVADGRDGLERPVGRDRWGVGRGQVTGRVHAGRVKCAKLLLGVTAIASSSSTFEKENINLNIRKSFAYLDFSTFWK